MVTSTALTGQHLAAISPSKEALGPLIFQQRDTPTPGPRDILVDVKAIALNPADVFQRDVGFPPVKEYPAVLGCDIAGVVIAVGSEVSSSMFQPGSRVTALATTFFQGGSDYGSFQTKVLVPSVQACPVPNNLSFSEGAILPLATTTVWSGWYRIGLARDTALTPADKQGLLLWGASGSVGSIALQSAKLMGYTVYATASEKNHEYLKGLGADRLFDYKSADPEGDIIKAAKQDGLTFNTGYVAANAGFDAKGAQEPCMRILEALKSKGTVAKLASAPLVSKDLPKVEGVEVQFSMPPDDTKEMEEHFRYIYNASLKEKLEKGELVPSPHVQVVDGGLRGVNKGLDILKEGVSCKKLVLEV